MTRPGDRRGPRGRAGAFGCKAAIGAAVVVGIGVGILGGTGAARAEAPAEPPAGGAGGDVDEAEIARALAADQAAHAKTAPSAGARSGTVAGPAGVTVTRGNAGAPLPTGPSGTASATGVLDASDTSLPPPQVRSFQSLNPDMSAIVDFAAGWFSDDAGTVKSGDDPQSTGFKVQEVELALQQVVDPYFRADIFLTIPNLSGLEVEEAFLTTTQLPGNLQIKAGIFRAGLGRQNAQHLHLQDFSRRPALNTALLGVDGLRAPGLETSWLVPELPFYLMLSAAAFSVDAAEADQPLQTFGGGARWNLSYVGAARAFFPLSEATSLYLGLDYARGKSSQSVSDPTAPAATDAAGHTLYDGHADNLVGADLYLKWKPANQAETYASAAWQTEYFVRQIPNLVVPGAGGVAGRRETESEGGLYSQVVVQTARRFFLGLRGELLGLPAGDNLRGEYAGALSVTWALSEFARVRLCGETRRGPRFLPLDPAALSAAPSSSRTSGAVFLQLEAAIGAHGAHPF